MTLKYTNNAKTTLNGAITNVATSIVVTDGSVFPTLTGAEYFYMTLEDMSLNREVVKVTARSGNTLTVVRAQDGTTARAFSNADKAEGRICAALLTDLVAPANLLSALLTVDGAGSSLDADTLDGQHGSYYRDATNLNAGTIADARLPSSITGKTVTAISGAGGVGLVDIGQYITLSGFAPNIRFVDLSSSINPWFVHYNQSTFTIGEEVSTVATTRLAITTSALQYNGNTIWHTGNDGAGSGLDADLLDGLNSVAFGQLAGTNTWTGAQSVNVNASTQFTVQRTDDGSSGAQIDAIHVSTTPATNDSPFTLRVLGRDSLANITVYGRLRFFITTATDGAEAGYWQLAPTTAGAETAGLAVTGTTMTFNASTVWHAGNDGAGSGLDADLLDGYNIGTFGSAIPLLSGTNTWGGAQTFPSATGVYDASGAALFIIDGAASNWRYILGRTASSNRWALILGNSSAETGANAGSHLQIQSYDDTGVSLRTDLSITRSNGAWAIGGTSITAGGNTMWHAGNDGASSGLDADLLDGVQLSAIAQLSGAAFTGAVSSTGQISSTASTGFYANYSSGAQGGRLQLKVPASGTTIAGDIIIDTNGETVRIFENGGSFRGVLFTVNACSSQSLLWHSGNDGSGSTLDADLWDGNQFATYLNQAVLSTSSPVFSALRLTLATGRQFYIRQWADFSDNYSGYAVMGANLYSQPDTSTYITPNTHASVGYAAIRMIQGTIQFAGFSGATTAGATVTPTWNTMWHAGNDGAGSGLDADLWDGNQFASYLNQAVLTSSGPTFAGLTSTASIQTTGVAEALRIRSDVGYISVFDSANSTRTGYIQFNAGSSLVIHNEATNGALNLRTTGTGVVQANGNTIWHAGNDGSGSTLDADLLDGVQLSAIGQLAGTQTWTGPNTFSTTTASSPITVVSTDDGVSAVGIDMWKNSPSPAANDYVANIRIYGQNASGTQTLMSRYRTQVLDTTAASEDATTQFGVRIAGTLVDVLALGITSIENRFTMPTDSIVSSHGTSGYGAFQAVSSGTNTAYMFWNNITTGELARISVTNAKSFLVSMNGGTTSHMNLTSTGAVTFAGDVTANSDERLKKDVLQITNAMDIIREIRGVTFTRKDGDNTRSMGVIAQELIKAGAPELVRENEDGYLSVAYGNAVGLLVEGIKELERRLAELESRIV